MASTQFIIHPLHHSNYAKFRSCLFFSYNGKLANKDPNHKDLVILGIPCSPLSHSYDIEPIKGSVIRETIASSSFFR